MFRESPLAVWAIWVSGVGSSVPWASSALCLAAKTPSTRRRAGPGRRPRQPRRHPHGAGLAQGRHPRQPRRHPYGAGLAQGGIHASQDAIHTAPGWPRDAVHASQDAIHTAPGWPRAASTPAKPSSTRRRTPPGWLLTPRELARLQCGGRVGPRPGRSILTVARAGAEFLRSRWGPPSHVIDSAARSSAPPPPSTPLTSTPCTYCQPGPSSTLTYRQI